MDKQYHLLQKHTVRMLEMNTRFLKVINALLDRGITDLLQGNLMMLSLVCILFVDGYELVGALLTVLYMLYGEYSRREVDKAFKAVDDELPS